MRKKLLLAIVPCALTLILCGCTAAKPALPAPGESQPVESTTPTTPATPENAAPPSAPDEDGLEEIKLDTFGTVTPAAAPDDAP